MSGSRPNSAAEWPTHRARARERRRATTDGPIRLRPKLKPIIFDDKESAHE